MYKYNYDESESRVALSLKMFNQIERYLIDFLEYVPLDFKQLDVYSLKLVTALLEIGPEIISSFDIAVFSCATKSINDLFDDGPRRNRVALLEKEKDIKPKNRSLTFKNYYSHLDSYGFSKISRASVRLIGLDAYIQPFENSKPKWWTSYNLLKHDKYDHLKMATLRTVLKASSALFWLVYNNLRMIRSYNDTPTSNLFVKIEPYELDGKLASLEKI